MLGAIPSRASSALVTDPCAEDHGRRIDKAKHHPRLGHRINAVGPHHRGLHLLLAEVGQNVLVGNWPWAMPTVCSASLPAWAGTAQRPARPRRGCRSAAGLAQRLVELLQLGRHHAVAQIHRRRRILHRPVVDHHQLLHIVRNRSARIRGQLRRGAAQPPPAERCNRNLTN
jgi:hypothetical protein